MPIFIGTYVLHGVKLGDVMRFSQLIYIFNFPMLLFEIMDMFACIFSFKWLSLKPFYWLSCLSPADWLLKMGIMGLLFDHRHLIFYFACNCEFQENLRKPKGIASRVRRKFKGCTLMPNIGYGSDKKTRHYLPNGFKKFVVYNVKELEILMMHNRCLTLSPAYLSQNFFFCFLPNSSLIITYNVISRLTVRKLHTIVCFSFYFLDVIVGHVMHLGGI